MNISSFFQREEIRVCLNYLIYSMKRKKENGILSGEELIDQLCVMNYLVSVRKKDNGVGNKEEQNKL